MPVYHVKDKKTGMELDLRGDSPPTDDELATIFDQQAKNAPKPRARTWTDTAVDSLPAIGGMVGGALGSLTGLPTLGVGAVPGAIAGAGILGAGGEAAKQFINRARGVETPSTPGEAASDIGLSGATQAAFEGAGQAIPAALKAGGTAIYRGYLKPSLSRVNLPKAARVVKDAIAENLPITEHGAARAQQLIGDLNGQVNDILSRATGKTVDLHEVADRVRSFAQRVYNRPGRAPEDFEAAMKVADRIDNHPSMQPSPPNTPRDLVDLPTANQTKQDIQGAVGDKFGRPGGTAETNTEKMASSAMRRAVERKAPEVGPLNARESRLIDVAEALNRATGREANQSVTHGVKTLIAGSAGGADYARHGNPYEAAVTALATRLALTPAVASRAAILAVKMGEKMPGTAAADVARVAARVVSESEE